MSPLHHPSDETLLAHAAGALDEAFRVIVAVHIAACAQCRSLVLRAEQVGGEMLDTLAATAMTGDALDRTLARLDEQGPADRPAAPPPDGLPLQATRSGAGAASFRASHWPAFCRWNGAAPGCTCFASRRAGRWATMVMAGGR